METILQFFSSNPLAMAAAIVVSLVVLFLFLKKLLKALLVVAAVAVLYAAWLLFSGGTIHPLVLELQERLHEAFLYLMELFRAAPGKVV